MVRMEKGIAHIGVINVGCNDVLLYPRTWLGTVTEVAVASLPPGVTEVLSCDAAVAFHSGDETLLEQIKNMDLSGLSEPDKQTR